MNRKLHLVVMISLLGLGLPGAVLAADSRGDPADARTAFDEVLLVAKTKSARATCAVARANRSIDATAIGKPRGWLGIVGTGPGSAVWIRSAM